MREMDRQTAKQIREHRLPALTVPPGRYLWADGCAVVVEHIHGPYSAVTLYHPSPTHRALMVRPDRELTATP